MKRLFSLLEMVASFACFANAATISEIKVHSESMNTDINVSVVFPESYKTGETRYPVIYMLHGAGGSFRTYASDTTKKLVDEYNCIAVCPDGHRTSWWLDSPVDPAMKYETFVIKEVIPYIDKTYRTLNTREKRAVMGGSMGGHGACYLGFRHKDLFGAVGNIFGGVDLRPFPDGWDIKLRLGTLKEHPEYWEQYSAFTQAKDLKNGEISFITMIGTNDFFLQVNRNMHDMLTKMKVEHIYIEMRGADEPHSSHNGAFGIVAEEVLTRYIHNFFAEGKGRL